MAHELIFKGSFEDPNDVEVSFYVGPDGYVYVEQKSEDNYLKPSRLEEEDLKTLIDFFKKHLSL